MSEVGQFIGCLGWWVRVSGGGSRRMIAECEVDQNLTLTLTVTLIGRMIAKCEVEQRRVGGLLQSSVELFEG